MTWLDDIEAGLRELDAAVMQPSFVSAAPADLRRLLRVARAAGPLLAALDDCEIEHVGHECPMWPEGYHGDECTCGARHARERAETLRGRLMPRGGKREGAGRPPGDPAEVRSAAIMVKLNAGELAAIDAARGETDRAVWVRQTALAKAKRAKRP